jgi:hypothetical protein
LTSALLAMLFSAIAQMAKPRKMQATVAKVFIFWKTAMLFQKFQKSVVVHRFVSAIDNKLFTIEMLFRVNIEIFLNMCS